MQKLPQTCWIIFQDEIGPGCTLQHVDALAHGVQECVVVVDVQNLQAKRIELKKKKAFTFEGTFLTLCPRRIRPHASAGDLALTLVM
jgi:hypothetical protein